MRLKRAVAALAVPAAAAACCAGCGPDRPAAANGPRTPVAVTAPPAKAPAARPSAGPKPLASSAPVRLEIPAIGVDTPVMRLGLAADGTVEVPPIAAHAPAGWYDGSPTPGRTGPSVILAHVTVGRYGDGVFLHLSRLRPGDRVTARLRDGATAGFTVESVRTVAKAHFPTASVYGDTARPELRLITCGGPRDAAGTGYADNVVVYADLTSTTPATTT
ncbi:class F sortase [Streptomyces sp. SL13]|uniref:Class F sortase n=1 Tax=Streptantibioticus silvisoli TaxID=2705255 RepID=A0AA90KH31_9ACTN|nr:class F sortase [Streptantibioticus silvisoli]MDI5962026.1 class F sortase [Streptantibioticus silvisoli]MDI5971250.1 class F sortase [Streptantibioticus silvisoli]